MTRAPHGWPRTRVSRGVAAAGGGQAWGLFGLVLSGCCCPWLPGNFAREAPVEVEAPPTEPPPAVPASLTSPAESARARPLWVSGTADAPQAPAEVSLHAAPASGALAEGLLACSVRSAADDHHPLKANDAPDLDIVLSVDGREVEVAGPDDQRMVAVTMPLVALAPGATISAHVWDRGLFRRRSLGSVSLDYAAFPQITEDPQLALSCAWVPRTSLEPLVTAYVAAADQRLAAWNIEPEFDESDLRPETAAVDVLTPIQNAAALVGWADPRVHRRVQEYEEHRAAYLAALRAGLDTRLAEVPVAWSTMGDLEWKPATAQVGEHGLVVRVPVRGDKAAPPRGSPGELGALGWPVVIDVSGRTVPLTGRNLERLGFDDVPLVGEDVAVLEALSETQLDPPLVLRVGSAGHTAFQRVTFIK